MKEFMNWADFLNAASDAIFFLDLYSTLWFLNGGSLLQLYMFLIINEEKDCLEKSWSESLQKSQLRKANTQRVFEFKKSHAKQKRNITFFTRKFLKDFQKDLRRSLKMFTSYKYLKILIKKCFLYLCSFLIVTKKLNISKYLYIDLRRFIIFEENNFDSPLMDLDQ